MKIKGFEDYEIFENGDIYKNNKKIRTFLNNGYLMVDLRRNGKAYHKRVHILVAQHFIPNPDNLPQVNHKDGNKQNPDVNNLEWSTCSDNVKHAIRIGLNHNHIQDSKHMDKMRQIMIDNNSLIVEQLDACGNVIAEYRNARQASKITGIYQTGIQRVCSGKRNTAGGYKWRYKYEQRNTKKNK